MMDHEGVGRPAWVKKKLVVRPVFLFTLQCHSSRSICRGMAPVHPILVSDGFERTIKRQIYYSNLPTTPSSAGGGGGTSPALQPARTMFTVAASPIPPRVMLSQAHD